MILSEAVYGERSWNAIRSRTGNSAIFRQADWNLAKCTPFHDLEPQKRSNWLLLSYIVIFTTDLDRASDKVKVIYISWGGSPGLGIGLWVGNRS